MQRGEVRWHRFGAPDKRRPEVDGMPRASVVNLDHLQTISRKRLAGLITILPSHRMEEVRTALLFALGFR